MWYCLRNGAKWSWYLLQTTNTEWYVAYQIPAIWMTLKVIHLTNLFKCDCLSNAFYRLSNHFGFCLSVCMSVCPQIGCRTITSTILYWFSPNFACRSEIWLFRRLLFLGQTGRRLPILEVCKIRFWQFRDCVDIFSHGSSQKLELRYN